MKLCHIYSNLYCKYFLKTAILANNIFNNYFFVFGTFNALILINTKKELKMNMIKWKPTNSILDNKIDKFFGFFPENLNYASSEDYEWSPAVDVNELKDHYTISMDLPGLSKSDIDISTSGDTITIKGNRERKAECKNDFYHYNEIGYGTFKRKFNIKNIVNIEGIKANFKNGVLQINLPKKEDKSQRVKSIKVN